jgi:hypothetical protein
MLDVGGTGEDRTVAQKRPRNKRDWEILAMASSINRQGEHTLREGIAVREKAASWLAWGYKIILKMCNGKLVGRPKIRRVTSQFLYSTKTLICSM